MGYFRDDAPLIRLILDEHGKKELDALWDEFDFIADYTVRTYSQFIFNGGEGGGLRRNIVDRPPERVRHATAIFRLRDQYLDKAAAGTDPVILKPSKTISTSRTPKSAGWSARGWKRSRAWTP